MGATIELTGGGFTDALGNVLANGRLTLGLSAESARVGNVFITTTDITIQLDGDGNVVAGQYVYGNDAISPDGTFYRVTALTPSGQAVWGPNCQRVTGTGTFDLGQWIPNVLSTLQTPSGSSPATYITETFGDPAGRPIADGTLVLNLTTDAVSSDGSQVCAGREVTIPLDANGTAALTIYPNDKLLPIGTTYFAKVFTAKGQPVWEKELTVASTSQSFIVQDDGTSIFLLDGSSTFGLVQD
jgi:hypothetical protein